MLKDKINEAFTEASDDNYYNLIGLNRNDLIKAINAQKTLQGFGLHDSRLLNQLERKLKYIKATYERGAENYIK